MGEEVDGSEVSCCGDEVFAVDCDFGDFLFEGVDLAWVAVFCGGGDSGVCCDETVVLSLYTDNRSHGYAVLGNVEGTARRCFT